MAIMVPNSLAELNQMSKRMGLQIKGSKKDGKCSKEDYIIPIRNKILADRYPNDNMPDGIRWLLDIKSPMLAKRFDELKEDLQNEIWEDDAWTLEEKINGLRCFLIKDSNGIHLYSRENSKNDLLPIELTNRVAMYRRFDFDRMRYNFILDCELVTNDSFITSTLQEYGVHTNTSVQAMTSLLLDMNPLLSRKIQSEHNFKFSLIGFDCLRIDETSLINEPLSKRRVILGRVINNLRTLEFPIRQVDVSNGDKRLFYSNCMSYGLEGCIGKRLDSVYIADSIRNTRGWIKLKPGGRRTTTEVDKNLEVPMDMVLGDTVDAFISGFESGEKGTVYANRIKSIQVSVIVTNDSGLQEERILCNVKDMDDVTRNMMTEIINGYPVLKSFYYHKVVELNDICSTFLGFRYDKSSEECTMEEMSYDTLKNMYL